MAFGHHGNSGGAMMLVYVVEDDFLKASHLMTFLRESVQGVQVSVFGSFQSGLRAIQQATPDLVILDMTLPTFDRAGTDREGRLRPLGGYDLMRKLMHHSVQVSVVVVTQLETFGEGVDQVTLPELVERCRRDFPSIFRGAVYFRQADSGWQNELLNLFPERRQ
jgi:CheY-like chemotaxis protein